MQATARHLELMARAYLCEPDKHLLRSVAALSGRNTPEPQALVLLDREELLLAPGAPRYVPPYESLVREGRLNGKAVELSRQTFVSAGFDLDALNADPRFYPTAQADHLGYALAFTAHMLRNAFARQDKAENFMRTACAFFKTRIITWAPEYGRRLAELAKTKHYADLGRMTAHLDRMTHQICGTVL